MKILVILSLYCPLAFFGQSDQVESAVNFDPQHVQAMVSGDELLGYYFVYTISQNKRDSTKYGVQLYDANLAKTAFTTVTCEFDLVLDDIKSDGENLCFHFRDDWAGESTFMFYNRSMQQKGEVKRPESQESGVSAHTLTALPGKGFAICSYDKEGKSKIQAFLPTGVELWKATGDEIKSRKEMYWPLGGTTNYLALSGVFYTEDVQAHNRRWLRLLSADSGHVIMALTVPGKNGLLQISKVLDREQGYIVAGHYADGYVAGTGLALFNVSSEGELLTERYFDIAREVLKLELEPSVRKRLRRKMFFFHDLVVAGNKTFLVCETYDRKSVYDLVFIELDDNLRFSGLTLVRKYHNNDAKERIRGEPEDFMMATLKRSDYCYTVCEDQDAGFEVVHLNAKKGDADRPYEIRVASARGEVATAVKVAPVPTFIRILPAKPGHLMIFEYFKEDKKMALRLEKRWPVKN